MAIVRFDWKEMPPGELPRRGAFLATLTACIRGMARSRELIRCGPRAPIPAVASLRSASAALLRPEQFQPVLRALPDRANLIQEQGVDHVLILQTTPELIAMSAEDL